MNTKRRFLFGLLPVFAISFKAFGLGSTKLIHSPDKDKNQNETVVQLMPGETFSLPEKPNLNQVIYFINNDIDWKSSPPIVMAANERINGLVENPLSLDSNKSFALRYLGKNVGWKFSQI